MMGIELRARYRVKQLLTNEAHNDIIDFDTTLVIFRGETA